jgi:hypothetical protein
VTGIQLWITAYLVQYILPLYGGFTKSEVVYAFAFTSATGPILYVCQARAWIIVFLKKI